MGEEAVVPFPAPREHIRPLTNVRSTLIGASYRLLREHGYGDRYLRILPFQHHDTVLYSPAGIWMPAGE